MTTSGIRYAAGSLSTRYIEVRYRSFGVGCSIFIYVFYLELCEERLERSS
jgi:hypothetical protein